MVNNVDDDVLLTETSGTTCPVDHTWQCHPFQPGYAHELFQLPCVNRYNVIMTHCIPHFASLGPPPRLPRTLPLTFAAAIPAAVRYELHCLDVGA